MRREGRLAPETWADARDRFEAFGPTAQTVVREVARAMEFDREEYDERVTADVVETARQAMFAEQLAVRVDDEDAFAEWRETSTVEVRVVGHDEAERVAWHVAPAADRAVAATFQSEPEAAVSTVRRMAFNRIYREELCER
ncbi:DUF5809 family protein [Natronomonas marina]|jgi:hypothetical protein|uniref:DUF5809 family protein n=1 Tax=Natronomonas marina TaxID=2961939 RepID=UPI0020C96655|nr:DUF5809 family protein [Natronomonas marina]